MASASYAVTSFLGGEISQFAQGRFDKPDYHISLATCLNAFPSEIGPWCPRPGTAFAGATKGGKPGRTISWAFQQASPITLEFTDGNVCFRDGVSWLITNDTQTVSSISTANPAVVALGKTPNWPTNARVIFGGLGTSCPLLQNRQLTWTNITSGTGSLTDALTGATINGSTLGVSGLSANATISRIQDIATPYVAGVWSSLRMVQAETTGIMLNGSFAPQALTVPTLPGVSIDAQFALAAATFNDGPYLDAFTNGVQAVPDGTTGIVNITLEFPAYVATTSYTTGDFVTASSVNYESLVDQNIGNTPAGSPTKWAPVSASAAINPLPGQPNGVGQGFLATDIGRLVRLYSEPPLWLIGATYALGAVVSYNPTGQPGAATYWQSTVASNTGNIPGNGEVDISSVLTIVWELVAPGAALPSIGTFTNPTGGSGPAQWTWGRITALVNAISGNISGGVAIGDTNNNSAAFNGASSQAAANSAVVLVGPTNVIAGNNYGLNSYVGQNYSGTSATAYAIDHVTVFPSSDVGFGELFIAAGSLTGVWTINFVLYASNSPPSAFNNGTVLGTANIGTGGSFPPGLSGLGTAPVTIASSDKVTTYAYVWVAMETNLNVISAQHALHGGTTIDQYNIVAQMVVVGAASSGTATAGIAVELLGPPLLYTAPILTWQLGAYSNTTGWPTCGCYDRGRLWLGGAIPNRFDACYANGIIGSQIDFAPTDQYGIVTPAHAISYTLNNDAVNPILWMTPVEQGILLGTQQKEILLFPPSQGGFAPTNIDEKPAGRHGCANVEPRATEHTYIFVQRYSVKLMELFADVFSGKYSAPNLADKAQHIVRAGIAEIAYTYAATPILWGRCGDGSWFGVTYKRDTLMTAQGPTYYGWHRHALGSTRIVEYMTAGPSVGGNLDALTMVTNQTNTADSQANIRHVEILTDALDELTPLAQSWYLDDAVNPSSVVSSNTAITGAPYGGLTLNGLWHLNGESIAVFAGGLDCGNFTVANGSVLVPYGDGISAGTGGGFFTAAFAAGLPSTQIVVGFTYNCDGQLVRPQAPQDAGTRTGPALGKRRRFNAVAALFSNLAMGNAKNQTALLIGRDFNHLTPVNISTSTAPNQAPLSPGQTFSGVWRDTVQGESDYNGQVCWRIPRPLSCNIVAIEPILEGQD